MKKIILCFLIFSFVLVDIMYANISYAISDQEYARCRKLSRDFAQTEDDLNNIWKQLNSIIKNNDKKINFFKINEIGSKNVMTDLFMKMVVQILQISLTLRKTE